MLSRDGEADRERTERLARAFPSSLRSDVTLISNAICPSGMEGHGVFVIVQNEPLQLPYRIEHTNDDSLFPQLNAHQALIYACIRSRHLDGYVRQRQIRRLACGAEPWVVPFLVQLGSEYVVEILHEIEACLPLLDKTPLRHDSAVQSGVPGFGTATNDQLLGLLLPALSAQRRILCWISPIRTVS